MILNNNVFSLGHLEPGDEAEIVGFCIDDDRQGFLQRLYEVGFMVGEQIKVLHEAPLSRDPISIKIKEGVYALRREDADLIQVVRKDRGHV